MSAPTVISLGDLCKTDEEFRLKVVAFEQLLVSVNCGEQAGHFEQLLEDAVAISHRTASPSPRPSPELPTREELFTVIGGVKITGGTTPEPWTVLRAAGKANLNTIVDALLEFLVARPSPDTTREPTPDLLWMDVNNLDQMAAGDDREEVVKWLRDLAARIRRALHPEKAE